MNDRSTILGAIRAVKGTVQISPSDIAAEAAALVALPELVQPKFDKVSLCLTSAPLGQNWVIEQRRISGSS